MQLKKTQKKRQLIGEERELACKLERRASEKDDVRSQLVLGTNHPSSRPKKWYVSELASDNLLNPEWSTACFEIAPKMKRHNHFSRYRSSRDLSSGVAEWLRRFPQSWSTIQRWYGVWESSNCQNWSWTTAIETLMNGWSGLICLLLQLINAQCQSQRKLQSLECSTQQKLQRDGSWHLSSSRCLRATMPIAVHDRNTKWTFRSSNRARMGRRRQNVCFFRFHQRSESVWEYPNLVGHRNLCFQIQRIQSFKQETACKKGSRDYEKVYRRVVWGGYALE